MKKKAAAFPALIMTLAVTACGQNGGESVVTEESSSSAAEAAILETAFPDDGYDTIGPLFYRLGDGWTEEEVAADNCRRYHKTEGNTDVTLSIEGDANLGGTPDSVYATFEQALRTNFGAWTSLTEEAGAAYSWRHYRYDAGAITANADAVADAYLTSDGSTAAYLEFSTTSEGNEAMVLDEAGIMPDLLINSDGTFGSLTDPAEPETIGALTYSLPCRFIRTSSGNVCSYVRPRGSAAYGISAEYSTGLRANGYTEDAVIGEMESTMKDTIGKWDDKSEKAIGGRTFLVYSYPAGTYSGHDDITACCCLFTDGDTMIYFEFDASSGDADTLAALENTVLSSVSVG